MRCVTREDFKKLAGTDSAAAWHIKAFLEKGYIERVRHDLYVVISLETGQPIANRFQIASAAVEDACVSHHNAFEYYGVANHVFYDGNLEMPEIKLRTTLKIAIFGVVLCDILGWYFFAKFYPGIWINWGQITQTIFILTHANNAAGIHI